MLTKQNFKCDRFCGKCCKELVVLVDDIDIKRIKKLGFQENYFLEHDLIDEKKFILKKNKNGCIFLKKDKNKKYSCSIYSNRPKICRQYPFFNNKPIKSCYPEDMYPNDFFSFKSGKFVSIKK